MGVKGGGATVADKRAVKLYREVEVVELCMR